MVKRKDEHNYKERVEDGGGFKTRYNYSAMNQQIIIAAIFIFILILVTFIALVRIARIEWIRLNDKSPISKKHRQFFKV